jgi:hypothetical protein
MTLITVKLLKSKGACAEQVNKFAALFPDGVEPTEALCFAHAQTFSWHWAAKKLLRAPARKAYNEAVAAAFGRVVENS